MLQPRGAAAAPRRGGAARRAPSRRKSAAEAAVPTSSITLPAGPDGASTMQGRLSGSYNIVDSAWSKAGMLVVLDEGSAASRQFMHTLQPTLHFLSLAFCPTSLQQAGAGDKGSPGADRGASKNHLIEAAAEEIAVVFGFLRAQHPALFVQAIIGHGAAGDAALTYAVRYGAAGACPVRRLVLVGAAHGNLDDAPCAAGRDADSRWAMLSVHGTGDVRVPHMRAQLYHSHHRAAGVHALRMIQGAGHDFTGDEARVAATINDWLEGVRRLNSEDRSAWAVEARSAAAVADITTAVGSGGKGTGGGHVDVDEDDLSFWGF